MSAKNLRAAVAAMLFSIAPGAAHAAGEQQNLEELRLTVINLLQTLVDQGVMPREKAALLVKQAQEKAAADAAAGAKRDEGAVRVPYVPQTVRDEISKQVAAEVAPGVVKDVVTQAKAEGWGVPGALPDWLSQVRMTGDLRVRIQGDIYSKDNTPNSILDYNSINANGGVTRASAADAAFLNTTANNERLRLRARLGADANLSSHWQAGVRLSTGPANDPASETQNEGTTAARYNVGLDLGYIRFVNNDAAGFQNLTASGGRILNPWFSPTELVYARDLTFEGLAGTGRYAFGSAGSDPEARHQLFATAGAFPVQYVAIDRSQDKWMVGGQLGAKLQMTDADSFKLAAAYYDFINVAGVANNPSYFTTYNATAPQFVRNGNSMFSIATVAATDSSVLLYGLASNFKVADLAANYVHSFGRYALSINAEAVENLGFDQKQILARTGQLIAKRNKGYVMDVAFGDPTPETLGQWRATVGYRYVQRDAVLDAWTDPDLHLGGTNAVGYYVIGDFGLGGKTWTRLRYLSGNEIDGPPRFGVDVIQWDLLTRF